MSGDRATELDITTANQGDSGSGLHLLVRGGNALSSLVVFSLIDPSDRRLAMH